MVRKNIRNQYLHSFCLHSRCTGNVPPALFHFNPVLSLQYCTVHIGVPTTHKVSTLMFSFFFPVGTSTSCSRSFIIITMPRATSKFPHALQWHTSLESLHKTVLHKNRMQWLHADDYHYDDPCFLVIPSSRFQHCRSDWCAKPFHNDVVHAISAAIDSQQPMHPIRPFTGCLLRRSLAAIDFACRNCMRTIMIATSRICD